MNNVNNLTAHFRFNKAGQGCFYTGIFYINHKSEENFVFVYDCGTESKTAFIKEEIRNFAKIIRSRRKTIDLLVISHFHKDHISHIEELICKVGKCKTVAMPYLTPSERLLLCLKSDSQTEDYIKFLEDPHSYLSNLGVENIFYISNNPDDENPNPSDDPLTINPDEGGIERRLPLKIFKAISNQTQQIFNYCENISDEINHNTQHHLLNHKSYFRIDDIWEFRFFNKEINKDKLEEFEKEIKGLLKINEDEKISNEALSDYFTIEGIANLKKIYKNRFKDLNNTSLVLMHYPIINTNHKLRLYPFCTYKYQDRLADICLFRKFCNTFGSNLKSATLLNGDINFKEKGYTVFNDFKTHFNSLIDEVSLMQIPHHGSIKNSDKKVFGDFPNLKLIINNSGLNNRHKHPSPDLMTKLKELNNKIIFFNNEYQSFEYIIEVDYDKVTGGFIL